ncbi:MAG TPA: response regulator [Candidatus Sulfotelmatobacter sp.]|nr:response regulator [Candidatus Sulfotelmatobacter sp.]
MSAATVCLDSSARKAALLPKQSKRTLVVDDSATILHAVCVLLEHHKVVEVVERAESGPETMDQVSKLLPELVLLDADMPGMSGLRTALLLSQMHPEVEIVLMSMDITPQFRAACAGCGATAMIYKPRFLKELCAFLQRPRRDTLAVVGLGA